jgi:integrase
VAAAQNAQTAITLGYLVPIYLKARKGELREKSLSEVTRYLNNTWKPLHKLPIDAITRQHIVGIVDSLPHKVAADRARTALSALFSWAIEAGHASGNPTMHVASRAKNGSRNRVLSEPELREVWNACLENDHGRIAKLLILTGQRRNEMADLAWPEIDLDKRQIDLPENRTKNGRPHIVPLSAEALEIIKRVTRTDDRDHVFGRGAGGFSGWSKAKSELDERIAANRTKAGIRKAMPPWTLHDLRRTVVTHLVESRTRKNGPAEETWSFAQPHVVEMLVNHVSGHKAAIAGTYNKALYLSERRQALERWGSHLARLVS